MPKDPFEEARRAMERAQRKFEERIMQAREEMRAAMEAIHPQARRWPRGHGPYFGAPDWRPRRPFPKGPGGPMPMPVKPDRPKLLSGGAEAPLEE